MWWVALNKRNVLLPFFYVSCENMLNRYMVLVTNNQFCKRISFSGVGFLSMKITSFSFYLRWHEIKLTKFWSNWDQFVRRFVRRSDSRSHFSLHRGKKKKQKIAPTKVLVFIIHKHNAKVLLLLNHFYGSSAIYRHFHRGNLPKQSLGYIRN